MYPDFVEGKRATVETERQACCLFVGVGGEIDPVSADELERAVIAAAEPGVLHVHLDLSPLHFIDSSGLRVLVILSRTFSRTGSFTLVSPPRIVQKLLEVTHLDTQFDIHPDLDSAISAVHSR